MTLYVCEQCKKEGNTTMFPVDFIGAELMKAHLKDHDKERQVGERND